MSPIYCALVHYPVRDREGQEVTASVTNLDVHDIARTARTYGLAGYFVITPISAQRQLVDRIIEHWRAGAGLRRVPERAEALRLCRASPSIEQAQLAIASQHGMRPRLVGTAARPPEGAPPSRFAGWLDRHRARCSPALLLFGTGHGLAHSVLRACDEVLEPISGPTGYNHLSVRCAVAIVLDRLLAGLSVEDLA